MKVHGGAAADVSELEYISALHQTGRNLRTNGTVSSIDVQRILMSRYGIRITHTEALEIIRGLGGGTFQPPISVVLSGKNKRLFRRNRKQKDSLEKGDIEESKAEEGEVTDIKNSSMKKEEDIEEYLDLVQILSILLIPALARLRHNNDPTTTETDAEADDNKAEKNPPRKLDPQPPSLMEDALKVLLKNIFIEQDETYPLVDIDLMEALLLDVGEFERAQDPDLLREMVAAATTTSGQLDVNAFVLACTSDITAWNVGSEESFTTYEEDVEATTSTADEDGEKQPEISKEVMRKSIDYVIDSHTSIMILLLVWAFFFFTSITYGNLFQSTVVSKCKREGDDNFGCILGSTIWTWVVFAFSLSICGLIIVWPLSWGNDPSNRNLRSLVMPVILTVAYAFIPYFVTVHFSENAEEPYNPPEERAKNPFMKRFVLVQFLIALALVASYALQAVILCIPSKFRDRDSIKHLVATSQKVGEVRSKKAGARKINRLILNSHSLHKIIDLVHEEASSTKTVGVHSSLDQASLNYILHGKKTNEAGGILRCWRQVIDGSLFDTEGIWLPSRLLVIQGVLLVLSIVLGYALLLATEYAADEADKASESIDEDLPNWVKQLVPSREDVYAALYPACSISIIVMIFLNIIYIPSSVNTIMQFRCGMVPALDSYLFKPLRVAVDSAYTNTGNAIYGLIGSALLFYAIVGLVIFLFIYEVTQKFMIRLLAWGLGLGITIMFKMILVQFCQRTMYRSFYRIRPQSANIATLLLECWFLGLGSSVLIGRITQFLLAAMLWVGRIDVPFLSPNVNVVGYSFDFVPRNFIKDLLVHEAHHHPYLERLTQMYMMKLKHQNFCSDAGAAWRHLFILSFMPWMRKHRVFSQERLSLAKEDLAFRQLEAEEDERGFGEQFQKDLSDFKGNVLSSAEEVNAVREMTQKEVGLTMNKIFSSSFPEEADEEFMHEKVEF